MKYWENCSLENIGSEQWKPIKGYEGKYEVSSLGRVKCLERRVPNPRKGWGATLIHLRIMKQRVSKIGYLEIELSNNGTGRHFMVHRLVAIAFIENPKNKKEVNHKKGVKTDNRVSELEWATKSENQEHAYRVLGRKSMIAERTKDLKFTKKVICPTLFGIVFNSVKDATKALGLGKDSVTKVCKGRRPHVHGLFFKYV